MELRGTAFLKCEFSKYIDECVEIRVVIIYLKKVNFETKISYNITFIHGGQAEIHQMF